MTRSARRKIVPATSADQASNLHADVPRARGPITPGVGLTAGIINRTEPVKLRVAPTAPDTCSDHAGLSDEEILVAAAWQDLDEPVRSAVKCVIMRLAAATAQGADVRREALN